MKETVTLTRKEQQRALVVGQLDRGQLTAAEAAEVLTLSVRQVRRILAAYRQAGVAALAHGNRGRAPVHRITMDVRQQVLALAQSTYANLNDTHLTEKLATEEGITLSRSTVRRIRREAGLASPRKRRAPKHRQRRARMTQAGLLVQWDGSQHAWLEERGPRLTLLAAIDDATGVVLAAHFRAQEDAQGYLQLLQDLIRAHGIPVAIYHDRHGIFRLNTPETLDEQLTGQRALTQAGRALAELGISAIPARSPQAKGRIERLFGTFQDRLVSELHLANIATLADANQFLASYLPQFNTQFAVPAADVTGAFRPWDPAQDLAQICCFKYQRTVAPDNTVQLGEHRLQLQPSPTRSSYAHAVVDLHEHLDGSLRVFYQGASVASQAAPPEAPVLRARSAPRPAPMMPTELPQGITREELAVVAEDVGLWAGAEAAVHKSTSPTPAPNHPWRRYPHHEDQEAVTQSPTS